MASHFSVFHGVVKGFCGVGNVVNAARVLERILGLGLGVWPHVETWDLVIRSVCTQIIAQGKKEDKILELLKYRFYFTL